MASDAKIDDKTIQIDNFEAKSENKEGKPLLNEEYVSKDPEEILKNEPQKDLGLSKEPTVKGETEPLPDVSDEPNKDTGNNFKTNDEVYNFLKNLLETSLNNDTETEKAPIETQLNTALKFLHTGDLEDQENLPHCLTNLINCLIEVAPQFIKFPSPEETITAQEYFYKLGERKYGIGFPNVLGVIDCTHVLLQAPSNRPEIYINHNSRHSINVQIVCGADLQIYNVLAAFPGGMEDACIWQCSNLRQVFSESNLDHQWLIADLNYPQEPWIMTPLSKPQSPAEKLYNKIHIRTWSAIKKSIALLRSRFGCLQSMLHYEPKKVCALITACCVLHNICIQFEDAGEINPVIEAQSLVNTREKITVDSMEEGVVAREDLIKNYFTK